MRVRRFRGRRPRREKKSFIEFVKRFLRIIFSKKFIITSVVLFTAVIVSYATWFLPDVRNADQLSFAESTIIYDREALEKIKENPNADLSNNILYVIHGDENRDFISLGEVSPYLKDATIAIEDSRFYSHFGFDVKGLTKAVLGQLGLGRKVGGSTITQQLVKNTLLTSERSFKRKFNELLLAIKVEKHYEKDEILEMYLNKIPYGHNAHGIEAASRLFFNKSARSLTLAEASILASLPNRPTYFSPYGSNRDDLMGYYDYDEETGEKTYKKGRKDLVLQSMLDQKMITFEEFATAVSESKTIEFSKNREEIKAPHFVFRVRQKVEEKYGKEFLKNGGLQIFTTINSELQDAAEEIIEAKSAHYPATYGAQNVAMASISPDTGEILAYVGGKDYFDDENDGQVDVLTARRQPGSTFKPFAYAAAFEKGYSPSTVLFDVEMDFGGNYRPNNFGGVFAGPVSARSALNQSLNIPAVKMTYLGTVKRLFEIADVLNMKYEGKVEDQGLAAGLGVAVVEPLSFINSYQVFTGNGTYYDPTSILEIRDSSGNVLEQADFKKQKRDGLDPEIVALIRNILTDETTRPTTDGFDWNILLQLEKYNNGAKTGTSNREIVNPEFDSTKPASADNPAKILAPGDSWTIGFTPHLVTGVWVGNNKGGMPMKPGATGLAVAAPIWKKFMTDAHEILNADPEKLYNEPKLLEVRKINKFSGKLATDATPPDLVKEEVFASFAVPTELDNSIKKIEVDKISGRPATQFTPFYARTQKYVLEGLVSVRPDLVNWQNPVDDWLKNHPKFLTSLGAILDSKDDEVLDVEETFGSTFDDRISRRYRDTNDDVHNTFTEQNPPSIRIVTPRNGGGVATGGIAVDVFARARFGMKKVEFYLDDQLVAESTVAPYTGYFRIPESMEVGSRHVLRALAVDELLNDSSTEIEITIAEDNDGPEIIFLGPVGKQLIPQGSNVQILADVKDFQSGVKSVEIFLDNESLGAVDRAPYSKFFVASGSLGSHDIKIKAVDLKGNVSNKSIPVNYAESKFSRTVESAGITKITPYRNSISIDVSFPDNVEWVEFIAKQGNEVVFSERVESPSSLVQFQINKNFGGRTKLEINTKLSGNEEVQKGDIRYVEL